MKQNNILNTIAATAMALVIAVMTVQAAGAVIVGSVGFPTDLAVDIAGNIYVTDTDFNNIDIINTDGTRQLVGVGQIEFPSAVAVSAGKIYVADDGNNSIKVFSSTTGVLLETVGIGNLNSPNGVAVDSAGNIHVADSGNNRVQTFNINGSQQTLGSGLLNFPSGIAEDGAGNIYVADTGNNLIRIFKKDGSNQTVGSGLLNFPNGLALDSARNIYVADTGNDRVVVFNPDGSLKQAIGTRGAAEGQFDLPMGVAVDSLGNIYVADSNNSRVQKLAPIAIPVIATITAFDVGNGNRSDKIKANVTIMNLDLIPHKFAVDVSGVHTTTGFPLAGIGVVVNLNPGQSVRIPVQVAIPPSAHAGTYSMLAGVFPFDDEVLDPEALIGNLAGPKNATVS